MKTTKNVASKKSASTSNRKSVAAAPKKKTAERQRLDLGIHIVKLVKENPRRKGTFGFKSFQKIQNKMTVGKFVEAGGRLRDLHWDVQHGNLKLVKKAS